MSRQLQFQVAEGDRRQRLDVFLAARLGDLSRMRIANLLAAGACLVNQTPRHAGYHVEAGETVEITVDESLPTTAMTPEPIPLDVVYEDEQIIVVNKPSGMLVHPNIKTKGGTLANALVYHFNQQSVGDAGTHSSQAQSFQPVVRPGLVHRLDRLTSGLMVVAKTQRALSILTRHFHERLVKKLYTALVSGVIEEEEGVIDAPIGINPAKSPPRWVLADGKPAVTRFRVAERLQGATLLDLEPVTGRTNQLRIHCAYIGHPIIGDDLYGAGVGGRGSGVGKEAGGRRQESEFERRELTGYDSGSSRIMNHSVHITQPSSQSADPRPPTSDPRLCLHASRLEFHHPDGGRWMRFESPLPDAMQAVLQCWRDA